MDEIEVTRRYRWAVQALGQAGHLKYYQWCGYYWDTFAHWYLHAVLSGREVEVEGGTMGRKG